MQSPQITISCLLGVGNLNLDILLSNIINFNIKRKLTMENKQQFLFLFLIFFFFLGVIYYFWPDLNKQFLEKEVIFVTIKLDNKCSFRGDVFIVVDEETGQKSQFKNGVANLNTIEGNNLKLAISPLYPDFRYDGITHPAKKEMIMTADCSSSPRMQMIMESMKNSFNPKSK